ncbi:MAG: hypothetical protein ACKOPC_03900 [Methylocystis sp.]
MARSKDFTAFSQASLGNKLKKMTNEIFYQALIDAIACIASGRAIEPSCAQGIV